MGAADRAHAFLRDAILRGELAPGTMLSENELAAALQMSRTPIRAALVRLQADGWVVIYPQRGVQVRQLTEVEVREAAQVRHALETAGVQLGGGQDRARERVVDRLADNLDAQVRALTGGDMGTFTTLAAAFHRGFVEMAGNDLMLSLYDRVRDRQYLSIISNADHLAGEADQVIAEHRGLLAHAARGEWTEFAVRLREHQAHHAPEVTRAT